MNSKVEGLALSNVETSESELLSAADWVNRSRLKEIDRKEKEKLDSILRAKRHLEDQENASTYTSSELKGLAVKHGLNDFEMGDSVILTLSDSNVLEKDERGRVIGINETGDVLENVNMTENDRRIEREKIKKRARLPAYLAYDDAEFEEGVTPGTKSSILSQYDKEKKVGPKLLLGQDGVVEMEVEEGKIGGGDVKEKRVVQSLQVDSSQIMSDYLTPHEIASFRKVKSQNTKNKKLRKKTTESSMSLINELEATLEMNQDIEKDHGSRAQGSNVKGNFSIIEEERLKKESYNQAVQLAEEKTTRMFSKNTKSSAVVEIDINEDDAEIAAAVERARRLSQSQATQSNASDGMDNDRGGLMIRRMLEANGASASTLAKKETVSDAQMLADKNIVNAEGRTADGKLVFTSTTEFTTRLQAQLNERNRAKAEAAVRDMDLDEADKEGGQDGLGEDGSNNMDTVRAEDVSEGSDDEDEDEEGGDGGPEEDQLGFVHRQAVFGSMASTLQLLKGSGDLSKKEELAGRAKDDRQYDPSSGEFGVKLDYRDEFGRKLTQKEAFRQLSYRFHGFGPSRKKKEKRLKEKEATLKAHTSRVDGTNIGTMKSLTQAQAATGKAYITVQVTDPYLVMLL